MMKSWQLLSLLLLFALWAPSQLSSPAVAVGLRAKLDRRDNNFAAAKQPGQLQQCAGATTCISPANRATART